MYRFLYEHKFPVFLGKYPRVDYLGHMVHEHLTTWKTDNLFLSSYSILPSHWQSMMVSVVLHPHQHLMLSVIFLAILIIM